ncbi:MAG: AAA family ATPase, partial [Alphaproteobacteria bacterium]|nr:AAA family ATPase [Alphaproteobacteria bacterium]
MAIQFARARYISRSSGGNAVRSAAYNGRDAIAAERTGELYSFRHRDAPEHHEVLLPAGAAERFRDSGVLWNAAEAAERRRDAQVAREIVLALPANGGVSTEGRVALARSFAERHLVAHGLAVQLDVHAPHEPIPDGEGESEPANWHTHLLITTRRLRGETFAVKKARDLDPEVRRAGGRAVVADGEAWGALWRDHQDRYFRAHGLDIQVDPIAAHPGQHIGPIRMRRPGAAIVERAEEIRQANEAAARDPEQVLAALTRHNATFTERDVDCYLDKHLSDAAERRAVRQAVFEHCGLVVLYDRERGEAAGRLTTRDVREQEQAALADAAALAGMRGGEISADIARAVHARLPRSDQQAALAHVIGAGGFAIIEGYGTGKRDTLGAIHEAHARAGRRVIGLAPTNAAAQDLVGSGFGEASTVHAALFRLKTGRDHWDAKTVVVVDEAATLDARVSGELLATARAAKTKVILAGDDREIGGLFAALKALHGSAEIIGETREPTDWQRRAIRDLAEGRFAASVAALERCGAITWTDSEDDARQALVEAWRRDRAADPAARRFVFAYTDRDVDRLNAALREVRRAERGFESPDMRVLTRHGEADFAIGDRVQFTDTDTRAEIDRGTVGTITGIDAATGQLIAALDSGRVVTWSAMEFQAFRHGYAGTLYRGQGETLDHAYLYHTEQGRAAGSAAALSWQSAGAGVFVARETAPDALALARQMARGEDKAASLAWTTREELETERTGEAGHRDAYEDGARPRNRDEDTLRRKVRAALQARREGARDTEPGREGMDRPVPAARSPRDELGAALRALDRRALAEAAAADLVGPQRRPMTPEDAARLVSHEYAAAA